MSVTCVEWLFVVFSVAGGCSGSGLTRATKNGQVRGFESEPLSGKARVQQYLGIPYAKPPVGDRRLERPEPPEDWTEILDVTSLPPACPQSRNDYHYIQYHFSGNYSTSEDCLYLNIYVPDTGRYDSGGIPVFVWVHGGSNEVGMGAMLPGEVLAAYGEIIVINVNYRLDILGFLTFEDSEIPGNLGVLDLVAALKWVKMNIRVFGGDPDKITVAGHSAGALNVGILMISPLSKGLIWNAVLQSGSAISFWSTMTDIWRARYRRNVRIFLRELNCNHNSTKDIKTCLKSKDINDLQTADLKRVDGYPIQHPVVVDGYLVPSEPLHMLQNNRSHVTSVFMGFTKDEGVQLLGYKAYSSSGGGKRMNLAFLKTYLRGHFHFQGPATNVDVIVHEYVNWTDPSNSCRLIRSCAEMFGDRGFSAPLHRTAEYISSHSPGSVYIYTFEHDLSNYTQECDNFQGVPHGEDIFYLFGVPIVYKPDDMIADPNVRNKVYGDRDRTMSRAMMDTWANFVKYGKPTHRQLNSNPESFNEDTKPYIRFYTKNQQDVTIETSYFYKPRKMAFWNRLMVEREQMERECAVSGQGALACGRPAVPVLVSLLAMCLQYDTVRRLLFVL